jgi:hypothetical protein
MNTAQAANPEGTVTAKSDFFDRLFGTTNSILEGAIGVAGRVDQIKNIFDDDPVETDRQNVEDVTSSTPSLQDTTGKIFSEGLSKELIIGLGLAGIGLIILLDD